MRDERTLLDMIPATTLDGSQQIPPPRMAASQWPFWREAYRTALWDELVHGTPAPPPDDLILDKYTVRYDPERKRDVLVRVYGARYGRLTGV